MISQKDPVTKVPRIGPKSARKLKHLGIESVKDLIYHFPFRYEDRSQITLIENLKPGQSVTIEAKLASIRNIYTKNRKRITRGVAQDKSGEISLIWFNMHYIEKSLRVGETYFMSGKIDKYNGKLTLVVPKMEKNTKNNLHAGRIVPIYHQTDGISSRWLRSRINDVLKEMKKENGTKTSIEDFFPETLLEKEKLMDLENAISQIHFPKSWELMHAARKRLGYQELLVELLRVEEAKHERKAGLPAEGIMPNRKLLKEFTNKLPFKLTKSQETAIDEILEDLKKDIPMNRLLEGDVGTGKTIVAVIAALAAAKAGKSVLYMAPTEILAKQHFETFQKYLEPISGINVYSRFGSSQKEPLEMGRDTPSVTVGTHALLYTREKYKNIGLVIIDEQHRFGVDQREMLLHLNSGGKRPHLLTMTATPIPRTLALTIYGDLDISTLDRRPGKKADVVTKVVPPEKRKKVYKWIAQSGKSAFIVCPFIEESENENFSEVKSATEEYEKLKSGVFKGKKVGLLHGRLKSEEKEQVVQKFEEGKLNVLVSTPVIEVGIDIPHAAIMVIESAERYGLASLHQLRGRVGRGESEGYCFVFTESGSDNVMKRLKYLESVHNGLKLAEIDLKLRGQGDLWGTKQHGFKSLQLADLGDVGLLERVRETAKNLFPRLNQKEYKALKSFLDNKLPKN